MRKPHGRKHHPHTLRCGLCGQSYAVLNSTLHVSSLYRMRFCGDCTQILLTMIRKTKVALALER